MKDANESTSSVELRSRTALVRRAPKGRAGGRCVRAPVHTNNDRCIDIDI